MTKNWTIHQLEAVSDTGYVIRVHWRLSMQDGEHYADTYSVLTYEQEEKDIIPFESLTKEIVVSWVEESLGEEKLAEMEANLIAQIEEKKNPKIIKALPWEM